MKKRAFKLFRQYELFCKSNHTHHNTGEREAGTLFLSQVLVSTSVEVRNAVCKLVI